MSGSLAVEWLTPAEALKRAKENLAGYEKMLVNAPPMTSKLIARAIENEKAKITKYQQH